MMTTVDEYITHPTVIPLLDEATTVAIGYINKEMDLRPCVSGCQSYADLDDFTDANIFLAEAYEKVVGREPILGLENDVVFLNELARRLDLWLKFRDVEFTEEMARRLVDGIQNDTVDMWDIMALVQSIRGGEDELQAFIREQPAFR